ncbi:hypothetical protein FDECE_13489 [Fusarium decemcellulare]|nr:hypothetical protein FDECE_13489 [Fusarium decemcellulare]
MVSLLVDKGMDLNPPGARSVVDVAVAAGQKAAMELSIKRCVNVSLASVPCGQTAVHTAAVSGQQDILAYLLYLDPSLINREDQRGHTPIAWVFLGRGQNQPEILGQLNDMEPSRRRRISLNISNRDAAILSSFKGVSVRATMLVGAEMTNAAKCCFAKRHRRRKAASVGHIVHADKSCLRRTAHIYYDLVKLEPKGAISSIQCAAWEVVRDLNQAAALEQLPRK